MGGVPVGAVRLEAGVYALGDTLHVDAEELCAAHGVPATDENLRTLVRAAMRIAAEDGLELDVREKG